MSKSTLRKQSLASVSGISAASCTASTPWDTQARPYVPDFSAYLSQAKSLCPHLIADPTPPPPPAAHTTSHSTAAQLLRLTRLQAEWEARQLAVYEKQIREEHAPLVSSQSLHEQHTAQQLLLSHLQALTLEGENGSVAAHSRHMASFPASSLNDLTDDQQTSVPEQPYHTVTVCCRPQSRHRLCRSCSRVVLLLVVPAPLLLC